VQPFLGGAKRLDEILAIPLKKVIMVLVFHRLSKVVDF
jgi:hypothetical protein